MTATIIGSTGLTGGVLLRLLVADSGITRVVSMARRSLNISNPKLVEVSLPELPLLPSIEVEVWGEWQI